MTLSLVKKKSTLKQKIYFFTGCCFLFLGGIGILLPVLPTTPFLLITAFCFAKSSSKWLNWLEGNRYFGPFILNYRTKEGIARADKIRAVSFLWVSMFASMIIMNNKIGAFWLTLIGVCVTIHIIKLKGRKTTE